MVAQRKILVRTVGFALVPALVSGFVCLRALADGQLSAQPNVGTSQTFSASENGVMYQSGTFTVARVTADSVRVSATDGLPASDQVLKIDPQGSVAQPSPASPFIDLLNYVAVILAAAPSNAQKDAQWKVSLSALSPLQTAEEGFAAGTSYRPKPVRPPGNASITVTTKLASVSGDVLTFHGEGTESQETATIQGNAGWSETITIDFVLKSGHLQSCTRTALMAMGQESNPMKMSFVTSLTAK